MGTEDRAGECSHGWAADYAYAISDFHGQLVVPAANASGHEEGFDEGDETGNTGPTEHQVQDRQAVLAKIESVRAEAAEEEGEQEADGRIFAPRKVLTLERDAL